jgi:hypothetical protein
LCVGAVERGMCGIASYGSTAAAAMSSVSLPSPVPRMMPTFGGVAHFARTAAAASWIWSNSGDGVMAARG